MIAGAVPSHEYAISTALSVKDRREALMTALCHPMPVLTFARPVVGSLDRSYKWALVRLCTVALLHVVDR